MTSEARLGPFPWAKSETTSASTLTVPEDPARDSDGRAGQHSADRAIVFGLVDQRGELLRGGTWNDTSYDDADA